MRRILQAALGAGAIVLGLLLLGCGGVPLQDIMNARDITSCIYLTGTAGPYASVRTITATGGATLDECERLR